MLTLFKTKLISKINLANSIYSFTFQLIDPPEINFIAGQYLMLRAPRSDGSFAIRQLSITTPPTQKNEFNLLFKIIPGGAASNYLLNSSVGKEIVFQGPAGKFALKESSNSKVFLATGTGIAPIWSMIHGTWNMEHGTFNTETQSILFWGIQKLNDVYYFDELKQLEKENQNFHFYYCLSKETNLDGVKEEGKKYFILGRVTRGIEEKISNFPLRPRSEASKFQISNFDYYLCGGRDIVEYLKVFLLNKGVAKENIVFEKF